MKKKAISCAQKNGKLSQAQRHIADWLDTVHFRKKYFGGVDEADVWKKLDELNTMYDNALMTERARYDALLERQKQENL